MRLTRDHAEGFHRPRGIAGISGRVARAWVHLGIVASLQAAPGDGGELLRVEERERERARLPSAGHLHFLGKSSLSHPKTRGCEKKLKAGVVASVALRPRRVARAAVLSLSEVLVATSGGCARRRRCAGGRRRATRAALELNVTLLAYHSCRPCTHACPVSCTAAASLRARLPVARCGPVASVTPCLATWRESAPPRHVLTSPPLSSFSDAGGRAGASCRLLSR